MPPSDGYSGPGEPPQHRPESGHAQQGYGQQAAGAPGYGQPVQPGYGVPAQPGYGQPVQPGYGVPQPSGHGQPPTGQPHAGHVPPQGQPYPQAAPGQQPTGGGQQHPGAAQQYPGAAQQYQPQQGNPAYAQPGYGQPQAQPAQPHAQPVQPQPHAPAAVPQAAPAGPGAAPGPAPQQGFAPAPQQGFGPAPGHQPPQQQPQPQPQPQPQQGFGPAPGYQSAPAPGGYGRPAPAPVAVNPPSAQYAPAAQQPWGAIPRPQHPKRRVVLEIVLISLGTLGVLTVVGLIAVGPGVQHVIVSGILALLPLLIVGAAIVWVDRWEPEPRLTLAAAFLWGGGVATLFSGELNGVVGSTLGSAIAPTMAAEAWPAVFGAPVVEEFWKGLGLLLIFLLRRRQFNGPVDGIVYASVIAAAFAFVENIQYFAGAGGGLGLKM